MDPTCIKHGTEEKLIKSYSRKLKKGGHFENLDTDGVVSLK
jgi:hypothetical protein